MDKPTTHAVHQLLDMSFGLPPSELRLCYGSRMHGHHGRTNIDADNPPSYQLLRVVLARPGRIVPSVLVLPSHDAGGRQVVTRFELWAPHRLQAEGDAENNMETATSCSGQRIVHVLPVCPVQTSLSVPPFGRRSRLTS